MNNAERRKVTADLDEAAAVLAEKLKEAAHDAVVGGTSGEKLRNIAIATAATVEALPHSLYPDDSEEVTLPVERYDAIVEAGWAMVDADGRALVGARQRADALREALGAAADFDNRLDAPRRRA